jgi:hypothetical protein
VPRGAAKVKNPTHKDARMFRSVLLTGLFLATPALALDPSASM